MHCNNCVNHKLWNTSCQCLKDYNTAHEHCCMGGKLITCEGYEPITKQASTDARV